MAIRVLVPSGVLGLGFDQKALEAGLARQPDIICIDGGSTDSGPFYLGTATSKYARGICKEEWRRLMRARAASGIPLVIGSCGTCGADDAVDWMYEISLELAEELGQSLTIARLYCEQSPAKLIEALGEGDILTLDPAPPLDQARLAEMSHIVGLAGAEQIQATLQTGADIILAGRTTDTAIIAALPLSAGAHEGGCWHGAKIAECGAFCSTNPGSGVILVSFDDRGFSVEAMADDALCTPQSVAAHMLYENADPFILYEPGGHLDVSAAHYLANDMRSVRVEGSKWVPEQPYTIKLEGAILAGYQTSLLAIIREPRYVARAKEWSLKLENICHAKIAGNMEEDIKSYSLDFRLIGIDASLGILESQTGTPCEIGVLVMITANSQELATEISKLINPLLLHLPLSDHEDMPTLAFPYSPAHSERGPLFEFALNHVRVLSHPMEGFTIKIDKVHYG